MIALCCHHRCEWQYFVGQKHLIESFGLESVNQFKILSGLTSWATCGTGRPRGSRKDGDNPQQGDSDKEGSAEPDPEQPEEKVNNARRYDALNLSRERRESIGRKVKRIFDVARCQFIREKCGLDTKLLYYCDPDISLENVVLLAKAKTSD